MFATRALSGRGSLRPAFLFAFCPTVLKFGTRTSTPTRSCRMGNLPSTWVDKKGRFASSVYARTVVGSGRLFCGASGVDALEGKGRPGGSDKEEEETGARRLGRSVAQALRSKGTRLVLHLDLNQTIIMVDPAGGKTQSQVLNGILAEICWGYVDRDRGGADGTWLWCQGVSGMCVLRYKHPPSPEPPSRANPRLGRRGKEALPMLTYSDFLEEMFSDGKGKDNRRMKEARDQRKGIFSEDGQPGAGLRREFLALEQALSMPESVSRSPLAEGAGLAGKDSYYVIPSFFQCLLALKEAEADFGVVFRTFGSDIEGVSREYNAFCEGEHPLFPGVKMDGSDGHGDYRVHLEHSESGSPTVGAFYRDEEGVALAMGTLQNPQSGEHIRLIEAEGGVVHRSMDEIHDAICEVVNSLQRPPIEAPANRSPTPALAAAAANARSAEQGWRDSADEGWRDGMVPRRCLALRDYYPFWRESLEAAGAGKLLPVDLSENPKVWAIMFDDNIGRPDSSGGAHIVDVRDASTGKSVPFREALRRHIVRAEPFLALLDGKSECSTSSALGCASNYFLLAILNRLRAGEAEVSTSAPEP
ncbi:unnamed protein product [Laminaria digitata]